MGEYETVLSLCVLMLMDPCQKETSVPSVDTCSTICKKCMGPTSDCRPNFRVLVTLNDPKKIILSENTSSKKKKLATQKPSENLQPNFGVPAIRKESNRTNARIGGFEQSLGICFHHQVLDCFMSSWWWLVPESCKSKRSGFCFF